jgi:tetratricopeptide (TPR) repeat protein
MRSGARDAGEDFGAMTSGGRGAGEDVGAMRSGARGGGANWRAMRSGALRVCAIAAGMWFVVSCAHAPARHAFSRAPAAGAAWASLADGKTAQARAELDRALAIDPRDVRALDGRALVAHETGDLARAQDLWIQLLHAGAPLGRCDGECGDPDWPRLALAAARRLDSLIGEVPGEQRTIEGRLAAFDAGELPDAAARRLVAVRARYARRLGREADARLLDRARGCPDHWFVAGPYGKLPRLDLARDFAPDGGGDAARFRRSPTRGCVVSVDVPAGRPGVAYVMGFVDAPKDEIAEVTIETDTPWRLLVDGRTVFDNAGEDRYPPRERVLAVELRAGWHRLALKLAAPGARLEAALSVRGRPAIAFFDGAASAAPTVADAAAPAHTAVVSADSAWRGDDPLDALLSVEAALAVGDIDAGEERMSALLVRSPRFAFARVLAARLALEDPSRPARFAQDRARRQLERALSIEPSLYEARYRLAMMAFESDRPRDALARLAEAPPPPAPSWRFALARYLSLRAREWMTEAEAALAEARRIDPDACAPIEAELALKRERHDVGHRLELARRASTCAGGSEELADALRDAGDFAGAIAEYERLLRLDPSRDLWRVGLAETLQQAGRAREAATIFEALTALYPRAAHYRRQLADALVAAGDEAAARRVLAAGLEETPESADLSRAVQALCERGPCHPLDAYRVDGKEVIAAYQRDVRERGPYTSPAVIVLDRTVTRVFATGARMTLTHNIIQVLAKDGIDKWGEVTIPEGADVLTLRAIKADGSTREPEEIAEKEAVSVPDLEVGDYVELEYVDPAAPPAAFPGGFLAERFYFQSYDAPLDRTEYLLVTPPGMPLELDRRADAPELKVEERDGLEVRTWSGRRRPQAFAEPASAPFSEFLSSARPASGLSYLAWRDYLRDQSFASARSNAELRALAERETRGAKTTAEKVRALDQWTRRHIKDGGSLDEPATSILAREEGNRVTLLMALYRAAGVEAELWLGRRAQTPLLDGPLPDLEAYDTPLIWIPSEKLVVSPRNRHSPAGFIAPDLRGQPALPLVSGPWKPARIPAPATDDRKMELDAVLALDGSAEVTVRERLYGWPALQWRDALDKLTADRVRPEFEQRTLGFYFPGSTLIDLKWSGADDDDQTFTVEYKFHAAQLARRIGRTLVLPAPYPATLGQRYIGVAARRTPLYLDYASPTIVEARVHVPAGVEVDLPPEARADGFGRFEQRAERTKDGLRLTARFEMPQQRVPPERYRELTDFAVRVDHAEERAAEIRPPQ